MVYYRKYRPQKISDLDSTSVREKLLSVFSKGDPIPHAFLFTGPKGLGKTSTARIVAKAVNCESPAKNHEPCNSCDQCMSITSGTNLDVLEIDAASNRGIDEIRDLKEKIRLAPVSAKKKVYIIDEVHMLTTEAFNALLKTLEEPPDHAMFILCTTEPHKVLGTIISRCFHIHFSLATEEEIVHSLKRIVTGEKLQIDAEVLYAIAKMADGGFRDAAKILEELSLLSQGKQITKESFEASFKTANVLLYVANLLKALKDKEAKAALQVIGEVVSQGIDMRFFITQILADLHMRLLDQLEVEGKKNTKYAVTFSLSEIKELATLFTKAHQEVKNAVLAQLPLELAVIEYCQTEQRKDSKDVIAKSETMKQSPVADSLADAEVITVSTLRKQVGVIEKNKALYGEQKVKEEKPTIEVVSVDLMKVPSDGSVTKEWQDAFWKSLISEMKKYNHTIAGVLRSCGVKRYDKEQLVIEALYKFHKERLDDMKTQEALVKVCKLLTGNDVKIAVELRS